jgi:hypothetical protein
VWRTLVLCVGPTHRLLRPNPFVSHGPLADAQFRHPFPSSVLVCEIAHDFHMPRHATRAKRCSECSTSKPGNFQVKTGILRAES